MVFTNFNLKTKWTPSSMARDYPHCLEGGGFMTTNQIAYYGAMESARHNQVTEAETERSNRANEEIARKNAETSLAGTLLGTFFGR